MTAPTAADLNRARAHALRLVREAGWTGPVAGEVTLAGGVMSVRAIPTQPGIVAPAPQEGADAEAIAAIKARARVHSRRLP